MESSLVTRDKGKPRKTERETIKRYLDCNDLNIDMIYDIVISSNLHN